MSVAGSTVDANYYQYPKQPSKKNTPIVKSFKNIKLPTKSPTPEQSQLRLFAKTQEKFKRKQLQKAKKDDQNLYFEENQPLTDQQILHLENCSRKIKSKNILDENNKFLLFLNMVFATFLIISVWKDSFEIIFDVLKNHIILEAITIVLYIFHIIIFTNTQLKNQKFQYIQDRRLIIWVYLKKFATLDFIYLLSSIFQILELFNGLSYIFIPMRVISVVIGSNKFSETFDGLENAFATTTKAESVISFLKFFSKVLFFLHGIALILASLNKIQKAFGESNTWIEKNELSYETNFEFYTISWYWGATILSTVGFGDITPANNNERFVISFIQILCCIIFGFFVNIIGGLIRVWSESEEVFNKEMRYLNKYLNSSNINNELRSSVRLHFYNQHKAEVIHNPYQEQIIFNKLTDKLKHKMLEENNISILKKSTQLMAFSDTCLKDLALKLKKVVFIPEQVLYANKQKEFKLWILEKGQVQEYPDSFSQMKNNFKKIFSYDQKSSNLVGWYNFISEAKYKVLAKAKIFTTAYQLEFKDFNEIIRKKKSDFIKMMNLKQKAFEKGKCDDEACLNCNSRNHNVLNCPRLHFNKSNKIKKQQSTQKRKKLKRKLIKNEWKNLYDEDFILENRSVIFQKYQQLSSKVSKQDSNIMKTFLEISQLKITEKQLEWMTNIDETELQKHGQRLNRKISYETRNSNESTSKIAQTNNVQMDQVLRHEKDYMMENSIEKVLEGYKFSLLANKNMKKRRVPKINNHPNLNTF